MAYAQKNEKFITLSNDPLTRIRAWCESTRSGFRHLAVLYRGTSQCEVARAKCCYQNRTWERYEYESVIHRLIDSYFNDATAKAYKAIADKGGVEKSVGVAADLAPLRGLANMAAAFSLLCQKPEDTVRIKKATVLAAGCTLPDGFDSLPTEEKLKRLNKALAVMKGGA